MYAPAQSQITVTTEYVLGLGGEQLTEINGSNQWQHTNVFAGGALLATYSGANTYFDLTDWQGTKRAEDSAGGCLMGWSSLPYGNTSGSNSNPTPVSIDSASQCSVDATEHHYTSKIHDSETGNDDFGARYYASTAARWLSPDWAAAAEAVPYATYASPQTLNLYGFVGNNPLSDVDVDGHQDYRVSCSDGVAGQCGMGTYPGDQNIFSSDGMGIGLGGADPVSGQDNMQETAYDSWLANAQLHSGSGFWSHVSNLLHGHSWNYVMRDHITVRRILPAEPNEFVTVAANAVSVLGVATHNPVAGTAGAALGLANHPDPVELGLLGMSLVPGVDEAGVALGAVYDGGKSVGEWITNNVMAPMLNAIPGPTIGVTADGQEVRAPDLSDPQTWGAN